MLDIKTIRENPDAVNQTLKRRHPDLSVDAILAIDVQRRQLLQEEESLRSERNVMTQSIAQKKKAGEDTTAIQTQTRELADRIKAIEAQKEALAEQQQALLYDVPNLPLPQVPDGHDEAQNVVVRTWGDEFKARPVADPLNHWEIGEALGVLEFERSVKIAQSRFSSTRGMGAWLERAIINLMLDTHTAHGYEVWSPPFLVNAQAMTGTGQLPKFEADMFACRDDALYLIPTAEVPLTNLFAGEILDESQLPIHITAHTPCYRREAGSAGRDTRGLIRQHQFHKVELVKLVKPEDSEAEHERLVADAERILQLLELPYRVVALCTGDLGFSAARCFDLEVWMPAQGVYREISSCSNFLDFQARRAGLKYRDESTGQVRLLHTLNGSGLAVGRTLAAILENYQISHQEVVIPRALHRYWAQPNPVPSSLRATP
jgi:seryl-tRNA synthetase